MNNRKAGPADSAATPGPYHIKASLSGVSIANDAGIIVARTLCCDRQAMADGALLAQSWNMLAVLKELLRTADETPLHPVYLAVGDPSLNVRDIIAKAEGAA